MYNSLKTSVRSSVVISVSSIIKVISNYYHYESMPSQVDKFVRFMLTSLGCEYEQLSSFYYKVTFHSSSLLPFNVSSQSLERILINSYLTKMQYYGKSI